MTQDEIKIGQRVTYYAVLSEEHQPLGGGRQTVITSEPFMLESGKMACQIEDLVGGVDIRHLFPSTRQQPTLLERFQQAQELGKKYLAKWLEVRQIQQERNALTNPVAEFSTAEDVARHEQAKDAWTRSYGDLGTRETQLNEWLTAHRPILMHHLMGEYVSPEDAYNPEITLRLDGYRIMLDFDSKEGLCIKSTEPKPAEPYNPNNPDHITGKRLLTVAEAVLHEQYPEKILLADSVVHMAQVLATARLQDQLSRIASITLDRDY